MLDSVVTQAKRRALIADDVRIIADTLAAIFRKVGYESLAVYSGDGILGALDSFPPDVLVSDVRMPGISGVEAAMLTVARLPGCRILLMSAQANTDDLLAASRARGFDFDLIPKPVSPADLLKRLTG